MKSIFEKIFRNKSKNYSEVNLKFLIVGLGNPGIEYKETRHNIGFKVVEKLAQEKDIPFEDGRYGETAKVKFKGKSLLLLKPSTFMNLSGKAVRYWLQKENIPQDHLLIICDDIAIPFGVLRMKGFGGDGGHNGLINIIENLGNNQFSRLRFGLGNLFSKGKQTDFVLGEWNIEEKETLSQRIEMAVEMIKSFVNVGVDKTMTSYNNK